MRSDQILARTMRYGDELTLLELGKKVEREQFIESTYHFDTMQQLLFQRVFSKTEDVRRWEKRNAYRPRDIRVAGPNGHGWYCLCRRCDDAVKRLLRDCGVLPRKGMGT